MKVKELIEMLNKCDKNMNVYAGYSNDDMLGDSDFVTDVMQVSESKIATNNGVYLRVGDAN